MSNTLVSPQPSSAVNGLQAATSMPPAEPIVEDSVELFDRKIGYQRYGHGPIKFLFICGGVGCYRKDYPENVLRAFDPDEFTIVCIDPPGYGQSRPPDRQQSVNLNKQDAKFGLALMQNLQLTPFACMGWSEGGRTAIHLAHLATPKFCSHLILLSTSTKVDFRGDMAFKGMRNTDQWLPTAKATYLEHYSEEYLKTQWAALCDVVSQVYSDLGGNFPADAILKQIKQPVLIVNGGTDRFILDPKHMTEKLSNSRVEVHAQGGHDLHIKYPRWFAIKLSSFVKDTPPAK
ncbi:putative alpha/beta hydrolase [Aphelenchoides besseyi]|nr:putative alpha/beta hydrolase [Aphelenchoides besseyi]KAI6193059.1 putative alpha/beta hydrolase [Aphelenchoides besseyi]